MSGSVCIGHTCAARRFLFRLQRICTPMHVACVCPCAGDGACGSAVIARRQSPSPADQRRLTACLSPQVGVVTILLANGADPNAKNLEGQTALFVASARGVDDVVGVLMSNGADADAVDNLGRTPLHVAMACAHVPSISRVVRLLVTANGGVMMRLDGMQHATVKSRVSKQDASGQSPLHAWAARVVRASPRPCLVVILLLLTLPHTECL
jgi:ankyrin repeat protein